MKIKCQHLLLFQQEKNTAYMTTELEIKLDMWENREPIVNKQDYNKAEKPSVKTA